MMGDQTGVSDEINGMVRAQSSLELLSATAAVLDKNEGPSNNEDQQNLTTHNTNNSNAATIVRAPSAVSDLFQLSPYPARVTPAESAVNLLAHSKSTLSLPDMMMLNHHTLSNNNRSNSTSDFVLEQKRSFLPFETSCAADLDSSPGLFLSYSNASMSSNHRCSVPIGFSNETIISVDPNAAPEQQQQQQQQVISSSTTASAYPSVMVTSSFSSGSGISATSASSFAPTNTQINSNPFSTTSTAQAAFAPPRPNTLQLLRNESPSNETDLYRENCCLRQQLAVKDATIETLQNQIVALQREVGELRQLPTGKISQIPIEDMLQLMREYGSEVSETSLPPRKTFVQKASVVRQFRRWNPNFLEYFEFRDGKWHPKLGKEGELKRRQAARRDAAANRKKPQGPSEESLNSGKSGNSNGEPKPTCV